MVAVIYSIVFVSSLLLLLRIGQRWWRGVVNMKKPLYAIKSVDDHTSQKMEIEQFASHSTKTELEALEYGELERFNVDAKKIGGALSKRV